MWGGGGSTKQHVQRDWESQTGKKIGVAVRSCRAILKHSDALKNTLFRVCTRCRTALTADLRRPPPSPLQLKCCCCWVALYPFLISSSPPENPSSFIFVFSSLAASQVSVSSLVLVDDVPAAPQLFPHVGHLLAKRLVLPLQEGGAHRDLVLLQSPGVPRAFGGLVVLDAPAPVLLVLSSSAPVWYVGVCGEDGGRRETQKREESVGWEGSVVWWEREREWQGRKTERKEEKWQQLNSCNHKARKPKHRTKTAAK